MNYNISLVNILILETELALKWSDDIESYISLQLLRDNCPCANCSGEKDIFGNIYKGPQKKLDKSAYNVLKTMQVGHYAIRLFWGDGHSEGLYTYELLRKMNP